jgi:intracellular sulfur oxidation DsrE/DsrF family protein
MRHFLVFVSIVTASLAVAGATLAQPGPGHGKGFRGGQRHNAEQHDKRHDEDHVVFQFLLENHEKITRTVKELSNGVETLTESNVPEIAAKIKEHVEWMEHRIENTQPIRMRDPLFAEIFKYTDKIKMDHQETEKGVRVTESSDDEYVVKLIQAHAKVVSGFVERGFDEAMKNHAVPGASSAANFELSNPRIAGHGAVVRLPHAAHQPRPGTKLLVDITSGGDPSELNGALEKVAKYLNIYAGGGSDSVDARIALVFHGDATFVVLNSDAYSGKYKTKGNPNLDLLHQLHEAGVELFVCGQSLISKGSKPEEVAVFVETAVSAVTAVVNLQADGYSYVPLAK